MADGGEVCVVAAAGAAAPFKRRRMVRYSRGVARAICARVAQGEALRSICAEDAMPSPSAVSKWLKAKPRFARDLEAARTAAGWIAPKGPVSKYCEATAQAIFARLCAGESLTSICRDPAMPAIQTVANWRERYPDFDRAMLRAWEVQADRFCDLGWEIAQAVTQADAFAGHVKLTQLRWMAQVMGPKRYGRVKAMDPPQPPERPRMLLMRHFKVEERVDGAIRVVSFTPDPETGRLVRDTPDKPWEPPPDGRWRPKNPQALLPLEPDAPEGEPC